MKKLTTFLHFILLLSVVSYGQTAILSGHIRNTTVNSIKCSFLPNNVFQKVEAITIPVTEGRFHQVFSMPNPILISVAESNNYYGGLLQAGDSVYITYDASQPKSTLFFSGEGKEKFSVFQTANQILSVYADERERIKSHPFPIDYFFGKIDSLQNELIQQLASVNSKMGVESSRQLLAHIKANVLRAKFNGTMNIFGSLDSIVQKQQAKLTTSSKKAIENLLKLDNNLSNSYLYISNAASILFAYYDNRQALMTGLQAKYSDLANLLPSRLKAPLRCVEKGGQ